jgi:hypothetical protein
VCCEKTQSNSSAAFNCCIEDFRKNAFRSQGGFFSLGAEGTLKKRPSSVAVAVVVDDDVRLSR